MTCELWVRGSAENAGRIDVDVLVSGWSGNGTLPTLTEIGTGNYSGRVATFYSMSGGWQYNPAGWYSYPDLYLKGDCTSEDKPYDCLNGGCVAAKVYSTPGKYKNFDACQSSCAKDSNCTGECVPLEDIAALQQAASNLRARMCK